VCSGYRDTQQLRIQDESQTTKQKALTRRSRMIPQTVTSTIEYRARNAFFSHYVSGFSKTYDILDSLYEQSSLDRHLSASVDAVSLAFFSSQFDCTKASHFAREKYSYALPLLNNALRSPETATSDSTLLAVLLLDLFEKFTNNNPRSTDSWMSHVNGALALVKLRNNQQFQNYTGLRLSVRLSTNLLISCVAANSPVPSALISLRSDLEPFINKDNPKWLVSGLVVKYANLKGAIQNGCLSGSDIIACATELDCEFVSLARNMPSSGLYKTTYLEEASERVLEQHFDTYPDHFTAQTWNVLRIMRILLNDIIRTYCIESPTEFSKEVTTFHVLNTAINNIDVLAKEICATAPQYTVYEDTTPMRQTNFATQRLRCYTLLFPLYVASLYGNDTTKIKPWINNQLRFMSDNIGIRNANFVAETLESTRGTNPWSMYAMLGSYAFAA